MAYLENRALSLHIPDDGAAVTFLDRRRQCEWRLDARHRCVREARGQQSLPAGVARQQADRITVSYPVKGSALRYTWILRDDHLAITLECDADEVEAAALPGAFLPRSGPREVALPLYQGVLLRGQGAPWQRSVEHGGHSQFSMAMAGTLAEKGALLLTHDSPANWRATYGEMEDGPFVLFEHHRCRVDGWAGAGVRLYPCDRDLTALCKQYRTVVRQRGEFVSWEEKIAVKPIVRELFGALIAFTGYNRTTEIDYVASARQLLSYGFDTIFFYPVRMCHYSLDFQMGGDDPVWLSEAEIEALKAMPGVHVAPWAWVFEGLDDGSEAMRALFRWDEQGPVPNWRMNSHQWYSVCPPYQIAHIRQRLATDMREMDWLHFDVNATVPGRACLNRAHALHDSRPMGALADMRHTRALLSATTVGNRIVSSEGFSDYYASAYDIGSTKIVSPLLSTGCMPVPMTMLVFHDSCLHDWWELHNYNGNVGFPLQDAPNGIGRAGSGEPRLKAALDALYGCPPNLFPFGRQYGWVRSPGGETFAFTIRLEDPAVQEAIQAALPVARLHRRIGPCELLSFAFLSEDRRVQATTFSDGTQIVANLSGEEREVEGSGPLPPYAWREEGR